MKNVIELYNKNKDLYTDTRTLINDYVKKRRTKLFNDELEAEEYAKKTLTYPYDVYNEHNKHVGFAVPR